MKTKLATVLGMAALVLAFNTSSALAKDKAVTLKGDAKCAMCQLHEGSACQTVIQTQNHGKTETYYVVNNDISKNFHEDVCHHTQKVVAKGTVHTENGKQEVTLTKIELAKNNKS